MGKAIEVTEVWKKFRIYHEKHPSLKETVLKRKRVSFEELWALKEVSFSLEKGKTLGIIGENGSGKSTLLKILARILRPDKGSFETDGKISALLELGAGFHPELTGRENIYLNGSILGLKKREIEGKFEEIVSFSGLQKFVDMPVKSYSSGMYLRLGFAVAVNVNPDILLIDEILAVGDELFQRKCSDKIFEFKLAGKTIVLVSHSLEAVRNLCETALWLKDGEVKALGKSGQVIEAYLKSLNQEEASPRGAEVGTGFGSRHGSYEAEIMKVEFLNSNGKSGGSFKTGDKFIARLNYQAHQAIEKPVFGVAIFGPDGTNITGPNTKISRQEINKIEGQGHIDYIVENLPLLPGTYFFSAALYDYSCLHPYDHQDKMYLFKVVPGSSDLPDGTLEIPCKWRHRKDEDSTF